MEQSTQYMSEPETIRKARSGSIDLILAAMADAEYEQNSPSHEYQHQPSKRQRSSSIDVLVEMASQAHDSAAFVSHPSSFSSSSPSSAATTSFPSDPVPPHPTSSGHNTRRKVKPPHPPSPPSPVSHRRARAYSNPEGLEKSFLSLVSNGAGRHDLRTLTLLSELERQSAPQPKDVVASGSRPKNAAGGGKPPRSRSGSVDFPPASRRSRSGSLDLPSSKHVGPRSRSGSVASPSASSLPAAADEQLLPPTTGVRALSALQSVAVADVARTRAFLLDDGRVMPNVGGRAGGGAANAAEAVTLCCLTLSIFSPDSCPSVSAYECLRRASE